jgi:hypothetical protein
MRKTVLQNFTEFTDKMPAVMPETELSDAQFTALIQEMKPFLQEAASDLLQPRKEALDFLLKKVLN